MVTKFPFQEEIIDDAIIRTFEPTVDSDELVWHQDLKDRKVKIIESGGWFYQTEDNLPLELKDNDVLIIPRLSWHRVIKGRGKLVVAIWEE